MSGADLTNQEKLEEVYEMTKENNDILRSLRRQQHIANAFRFLYWIVILVSLGGAYFYIRPVIDSINQNRSRVDDTLNQFNQLRSQLPEAKFLEQLIQSFKNASGHNSATTTE